MQEKMQDQGKQAAPQETPQQQPQKEHNEVEKGWEDPAEVEQPHMSPT